MNKVLRGRIYPPSARLKIGLPVSERLLIDTGRVDPAGPDRNRLAGNNSHHQLIRAGGFGSRRLVLVATFLPQRQLAFGARDARNSAIRTHPSASAAPSTGFVALSVIPGGSGVQAVSHLQGDENIGVPLGVHVSAGS